MEDLNIPGGQSVPGIQADVARGVLAMQGDSYPENPFELFNPIIRWVEDYIEQDSRPLTLELELFYLNTSSIRAMMEIFDLLEAAHQQGRSVGVNWYYDRSNERVAELAGEFKEDCTFPFAILARR